MPKRTRPSPSSSPRMWAASNSCCPSTHCCSTSPWAHATVSSRQLSLSGANLVPLAVSTLILFFFRARSSETRGVRPVRGHAHRRCAPSLDLAVLLLPVSAGLREEGVAVDLSRARIQLHSSGPVLTHLVLLSDPSCTYSIELHWDWAGTAGALVQNYVSELAGATFVVVFLVLARICKCWEETGMRDITCQASASPRSLQAYTRTSSLPSTP